MSSCSSGSSAAPKLSLKLVCVLYSPSSSTSSVWVCCEFKELTLAMANMQRIAIGLFFCQFKKQLSWFWCFSEGVRCLSLFLYLVVFSVRNISILIHSSLNIWVWHLSIVYQATLQIEGFSVFVQFQVRKVFDAAVLIVGMSIGSIVGQWSIADEVSNRVRKPRALPNY